MHPTDQLLSNYALDPRIEGAPALEAHLAVCPPCRRRLDDLHAIEALLADESSWPQAEDAAPSPTLRVLSAAAARKRSEDAAADALLSGVLQRFLSGASGAFVWADIAAKTEYHTGGVVRKLAEAADQAQYNAPRRALILGETASAIAGMLSAKEYSEAEIAALRGLAWKQRANANRHLGRFAEALEALDRAERAYRELARPELDLASITYIRGTIHYEQQQYDLAAQHAQESAAAFAQLGQTKLYVRSRYLQGSIAFEQRRLGEAQIVFDTILAHAETTNDLSWIATTSLALGNCHLERRELAIAPQYFHRGMLAFRELGILSAEVRCRWGLALLLQREERYRTAIDRLQDVREEFTKLGAASDAALVTLDIMETHLLLEKPREVRRAAGNIVHLLKDAGMFTGALTAADYLKAAAAMSRVTPTLIDYIRSYFRRVDAQPDLAFVPPQSL